MFSKIAITLVFLGCMHSSASASITSSPSVKYTVSPVKQVNGTKLSNRVVIHKVQLQAAPGISNHAIQSINLELARAVGDFKKDADDCQSDAYGHPWEYTLRIEKIVLAKKYISFVFGRETVCAGSPDFAKEPLVFATNNGKVISVTELFESSFPGRTSPKIWDHDKRLITLNTEMTAALLHDSEDMLKGLGEECKYHLEHTAYKIWVEGESMILVPEFHQTASTCQKEYMINLALAATPGIKYDKKKRTISLTANGKTVVLARLAKDEAPELDGMEEYIRILPQELQPYRDRGILLLNTANRRPCGDDPGRCDSEYEMYLHSVDISHNPPRQVSKVPLGNCSKHLYPDELKGGAGDFSAYAVDDEGRLNVYSCGRSATLSQDLNTLEFYE